MQRLAGTQFQVLLEGVEVAFEVSHGMGVGRLVVDAQAASHIDHFKPDALLLELLLQTVDGVAQHGVRLHQGDLGADVEMQAAQVDIRQFHGPVNDFAEDLQVDAELVVGGAGGDIAVGVGVDVGIDADGNAGCRVHLVGNGVDDLQFRNGFHIETTDAVLQGKADFPVGFSHPREGHFFGLETTLQCCPDFAAAHQVSAQPVL